MDNIAAAINKLSLEPLHDDETPFEYISIFKNPNNLPITQIHLDKTSVELRKDVNLDKINPDENPDKYYEYKHSTLPALDKAWLPSSQPFATFTPYNFAQTPNENAPAFESNWRFLEGLNFLLNCNFHQFWCTILFEPKAAVGLHSFLLSPILPHQLDDVDHDAATLYLSVLSDFLAVYERLITFQLSKSEHMPEKPGLQLLLEKKLLNLPIVITLSLLYQDLNLKFVNRVVDLYFSGASLFRDKEIEELLSHFVMSMEMIGGYVCGFEKNATVVPIAIDQRPAVFSLNWVYSVVNYLFNIISTLHVLLKFNKDAIEVALDKKIPYRLTFTYEKVFFSLYDMLSGRKELDENRRLTEIVYNEIAYARSAFIDVYNVFVTFCLDRALGFGCHTSNQHDYIEIYIKLLQDALEDEYFICDYHECYDIGAQNEMFVSCTEIDATRTDYIVNCVGALRRHSRLWQTLKTETKNYNKAIEKYGSSRYKVENPVQPQIANKIESKPATETKLEDEQVEERIQLVVDMFPHLGDGFVLACLEAYNYSTSDVIAAILEENLPPHIFEIPFDQIRIPPEPEPEKPILAYRHHKPDYDDALKLLNDKRDMKEIKTFILEGIQYTNEYDMYEDEYDDRVDEETVKVADHGTEDVLRFNPNYDDAVSDTSYSENEYDEQGKTVGERGGVQRGGENKGNFCEDPALVRGRRDAKRRAQGRGVDLAGRAKGQGQEKAVLNSRAKKNVNKSSRANHSRKSGAQFKRSKGMM